MWKKLIMYSIKAALAPQTEVLNHRLSKKIRAYASNILRPPQKQPRFQYSGELISVIR